MNIPINSHAWIHTRKQVWRVDHYEDTNLEWGDPEIAYWDGKRWYTIGSEQGLKPNNGEQVEILALIPEYKP